MRALPYVLVDVFTDRPLTGNPLAVFTDARDLDADTMQALARELNLSETTFVLPPEHGGTARVRIFTPRAEIPFAGHPTLGTALVLARTPSSDHVTLELEVGTVPVVLEHHDGAAARGWFTRPAPRPLPFDDTEALLEGLDIDHTASPVVVYDNGVRHAVVHLGTAAELAELRPDLHHLAAIPVDTIDVCVLEDGGATLRVFAPAHGIPEDPATGSAAAPVFCHLVEFAGHDPARVLAIRQGHALHRPSRIEVRRGSDGSAIEVGGSGVVVARGEFTLASGV